MVAEPKVRVAWSPRGNPAQMRLLKCQVFEIFFGGARGGGKTDGVLGEFGAHASRYGKEAIGLMVRRTRAELVETIERSREIYGPLGWQLNETEKMWRAPDGARLRFAYLERDADADMYQGHHYTRVYVEEVGNFPSPAPVMKLMATLRSGAAPSRKNAENSLVEAGRLGRLQRQAALLLRGARRSPQLGLVGMVPAGGGLHRKASAEAMGALEREARRSEHRRGAGAA
jgi:hypothetical protein